MGTIQEIAEELVNLSMQEVNELAMVMNNGGLDMPAIQYVETPNNHTLSPKEYGMKLMDNKHKRR
jgi:hypothetical protein